MPRSGQTATDLMLAIHDKRRAQRRLPPARAALSRREAERRMLAPRLFHARDSRDAVR